jgi:hypothetical protein
MRRQPSSWTSLFAKLGLGRKKRRSSNGNAFNSRFRFEQCEDRRMLATFTVNVAYDANTFSDQDSIVTLREAVFRANQDDADLDLAFAQFGLWFASAA